MEERMNYCKLTFVFWIHHKSHTNIYTEGYVGVTSNIDRRFKELHTNAIQNKHPNNLLSKAIISDSTSIIYEIIYAGEKQLCFEYQKELRPQPAGWNLFAGGPKGKISDKGREKLSSAKLGKLLSESKKEKIRYNNYMKKHGFITRDKFRYIESLKTREIPANRLDMPVFSLLSGETYDNCHKASFFSDLSPFDIYLQCEEDRNEDFIYLHKLT